MKNLWDRLGAIEKTADREVQQENTLSEFNLNLAFILEKTRTKLKYKLFSYIPQPTTGFRWQRKID